MADRELKLHTTGDDVCGAVVTAARIASASVKKVGLVVVHGIGDPPAGQALQQLTDSLEAEGLASFDSATHVAGMRDRVFSKGKRFSKFFPVHSREGWLSTGEPLIATEVFWGSASQVLPGKWGIVQGITSLLLNARALAEGADARRRGLAGLLDGGVRIVAYLLGELAFSVNALLILTFICYVAANRIWSDSIGHHHGLQVLIPLVACAALLLLSLANSLLSQLSFFRTIKDTFRVVALCGALLSLGCLYRNEASALEAAVTVISSLLGGVILVAGSLGILLALAAALTGAFSHNYRTGLQVVAIQFALWVLFVPLSWGLMSRLLPADKESWIGPLLNNLLALDGLQWLCVSLLAVALGVVFAHRKLLARRVNLSGPVEPSAVPRLIVNPFVSIALCALGIAGFALIAYASRNGGKLPAGLLWLDPMILALSGKDVAGIIFVGVLLLATPIRLGLDLAHDVITYVVYDCSRHPQQAMDGDTSNPMRARFNDVVTRLLEREEIGSLVIVAHSLGSVIAIDELARSWPAGRGINLPPVTLVTFGSPASHLFQFYFPTCYPDWGNRQWDTLFSRVQHWANIYRVDDYVGTTVGIPASRRATCMVHEVPIEPGGHANYWQDTRFIGALARLGVFERASASV